MEWVEMWHVSWILLVYDVWMLLFVFCCFLLFLYVWCLCDCLIIVERVGCPVLVWLREVFERLSRWSKSKKEKGNKGRTTPGIPTWSPTVVLTRPEHAWLRWADGKRHSHVGMVVPNYIDTTKTAPKITHKHKNTQAHKHTNTQTHKNTF